MVAGAVGSAPVNGGNTIEALNRGSTFIPAFFIDLQLSQEPR
jgi:hypothetical protein